MCVCVFDINGALPIEAYAIAFAVCVCVCIYIFDINGALPIEAYAIAFAVCVCVCLISMESFLLKLMPLHLLCVCVYI